ncbi:MAG: hypothetical protein FJ118_03440 [Deltaproteobacteria bacterium]|nr:hypothetical protein [Deltaproteobacteria bacterium]
MRPRAPAACLVVLALISTQEAVSQWRYDYDSGAIIVMDAGRITVKGTRGTHVLVPLQACQWCRLNGNVLVTFESPTRANLKPNPKDPRLKQVPALVVRDGRTLR